MAATRLIPLHARSGKSMLASLKERLDYSQNPDKTEGGALISAYGCDEQTAYYEFFLANKEHRDWGRHNSSRNVIAYQIRQSFKPGEITPEDANRIGYDLAMRFTKGKHAFTVSTHTDRAHIHNHIVFCSVKMDHSGKWDNFFLSGRALQRLSDIICVENHLSVIRPQGSSKRKRHEYPKKKTVRDMIREDIDRFLSEGAGSYKQLLWKMKHEGYEIRQGKYTSLRRPGQKSFIRVDSLGIAYSEEMIGMSLAKEIRFDDRHSNKPVDLMIDIEQKLKEGKGPGYERWAKSFNLKQMGEVLLFLQDEDIHSVEELDSRVDLSVEHFHDLADSIKKMETRLREIGDLKMQIINYTKTRGTYMEYRKAGYSRKFLEEHRSDIEIHKAAKAAFDKLGLKKLPKVKELSEEYGRVLAEKKKAYTEYRDAKKKMQTWQIVKKNVSLILGLKDGEPERKNLIRSR